MEIVFLGTGGSFPSPQRGVSSIAIKTHGEILLFDCGEGTQRQLMRSSLSFMGITKIFLTHFHGDHYLGLAGLLQTMALNGRTQDLEIFGPKGTEQLVTILERISYYSRTYDLVLHEMKEGQKEHFEGYTVTTLRLDHTIPTLGYLFEEDDRPGKFDINSAKLLGIPPGPLYNKLQSGEEIIWNDKVIQPAMVMGSARIGRRICIAMDTKPILTLPDAIKEIDVLIHEATADRSLESKANKFGHSTAAQAATIAKEAKVKRLFMVHISPRYRDAQVLIDEARAIFEESYLPSDLESFEVPLPESWEVDKKMWVVDGPEEGDEAGEAEGPSEDVSDGPTPSEVAHKDMGSLVSEVEEVLSTEVVASEPPDDQATADVGISLDAVEAGMSGKSSSTISLLEATTGDLATKTDGGVEEDEFDLEKAMREAGIDPNADDEDV